nr:molybdate ABC transporter substrate-binding protein [Phytoactinopolyspora mesophila]
MVAGVGVLTALGLWWWNGNDEYPSTDEEASAEAGGTVTVLAAASLTEAFTDLADELTAQHPELDIVYSFGPSSTLAQQAVAGAPADILVTADIETMDVAVEAGVVAGAPEVIARNTMALVTPADNPGDVRGLADLARSDLRIALCEPKVPCGAKADEVLGEAGVAAAPDTLATDVKEVMALVTLGEVDAALVYRTDALAAGDAILTVTAEELTKVSTEYPAALLVQAHSPQAARLVMDAMTGEVGRSALDTAGFAEP